MNWPHRFRKPDILAYEYFLFYWVHAEELEVSYKAFRDLFGVFEIPLEMQTKKSSAGAYAELLQTLHSKYPDVKLTAERNDLIWNLLYCDMQKFVSYLTLRAELLKVARENTNWQSCLVADGKIQSIQLLGQLWAPESKPGSAQTTIFQPPKSLASVWAERKLQF